MATTYNEWRTTPEGNRIRDLEPLIWEILVKAPIMQFITQGSPAKSHKHEWQEELRQETVATLTADISSHASGATGVSVSIDDSSIFTVGDQVTIDNFDPVYQVTAIPDGTTLTVKEVRNFALGSDAGSGASAHVNRGIIEGSVYGTGEGATLPSQNYNYTQIFRRDISVTKDLQLEQLYGIDSMFDRSINQKAQDLAWELKQAVITGVRIERTSSVSKGYMGGLRTYIDDGSGNGNIITGSGALTIDNLNDLAKAIYDDLGTTSGLRIVTSVEQSQVMSSFDSTKFTFNDPGDGRTVGTNVRSFIPNFPGSSPIPITLDDHISKSEIWMINPNNIKLKPLANRTMEAKREQIAGADAWTGYIIGEYTLQVINGLYSMGMVKGVSIPS